MRMTEASKARNMRIADAGDLGGTGSVSRLSCGLWRERGTYARQ